MNNCNGIDKMPKEINMQDYGQKKKKTEKADTETRDGRRTYEDWFQFVGCQIAHNRTKKEQKQLP